MSKFELKWQLAQEDLKLNIVCPFEISLSSGIMLKSELLVRSFGSHNGMLIVKSYSVVKPHLAELSGLGFGFSVMDEPTGGTDKLYDRKAFIDMLSDWGWTGSEAMRPSWLVAPSDE